MTAEWLEFGMLVCFGVSWPLAIWKTLRVKRVEGKSPAFMVIVILGYLLGIAAHWIDDRSWVMWAYLFNVSLVATDLALYARYSRHPGGR